MYANYWVMNKIQIIGPIFANYFYFSRAIFEPCGPEFCHLATVVCRQSVAWENPTWETVWGGRGHPPAKSPLHCSPGNIASLLQSICSKYYEGGRERDQWELAYLFWPSSFVKSLWWHFLLVMEFVCLWPRPTAKSNPIETNLTLLNANLTL